MLLEIIGIFPGVGFALSGILCLSAMLLFPSTLGWMDELKLQLVGQMLPLLPLIIGFGIPLCLLILSGGLFWAAWIANERKGFDPFR